MIGIVQNISLGCARVGENKVCTQSAADHCLRGSVCLVKSVCGSAKYRHDACKFHGQSRSYSEHLIELKTADKLESSIVPRHNTRLSSGDMKRVLVSGFMFTATIGNNLGKLPCARVLACLAFLDADRVRVPSRPLHTEADDIRPFLAVRVHLVHRELLQHLTLCLQLVQLPLVLLGCHLTMKRTPRGSWLDGMRGAATSWI